MLRREFQLTPKPQSNKCRSKSTGKLSKPYTKPDSDSQTKRVSKLSSTKAKPETTPEAEPAAAPSTATATPPSPDDTTKADSRAALIKDLTGEGDGTALRAHLDLYRNRARIPAVATELASSFRLDANQVKRALYDMNRRENPKSLRQSVVEAMSSPGLVAAADALAPSALSPKPIQWARPVKPPGLGPGRAIDGARRVVAYAV